MAIFCGVIQSTFSHTSIECAMLTMRPTLTTAAFFAITLLVTVSRSTAQELDGPLIDWIHGSSSASRAARPSSARPASAYRKSYSACLQAATQCDPGNEVYYPDEPADSMYDVRCCKSSSKQPDFLFPGDASGLNAGRCYVDVDDVFNLEYVDLTQPTWWGNFNALCSLISAVEHCGQGPLCDGLQLTATGTVFRFKAYSTTNPAALPLMDNCDGTIARRQGSNSTTDKEGKLKRRATKHGKVSTANQKEHRAPVVQQKVYMGYAHLFSGLIANAISRVQDKHFEGGLFEYVWPRREDCPAGLINTCGNDLAGNYKCGCWSLDQSSGIYYYERTYGWEEVDISEVPLGTPCVDGRIHTFHLSFYGDEE